MSFAPIPLCLQRPAAGLLLLGLLAGSPWPVASAAPLQAGQAKPTTPDQVHSRGRRDGNPVTTMGVVTRNDLDQVEVNGTKIDSDLVLRITWGDVPSSFRDGQTLFDRSDWANAAARFQLAAGDAGARPLVKAIARLRAGQALLQWGASEPSRFAEAVDELQRFLGDHPTHREVPLARSLLARAQWLSGKPAEAAQTYRALFTTVQGGKVPSGYDIVPCVRAGLLGARALLVQQPPDTLAARELFAATEQAASGARAGLAPESKSALELLAIAEESSLGDGYVELAAGNHRQALAFFESRTRGLSPTSTSSLRYACHLGLGEALLKSGKPREAQIELARVSAVEPWDRDRIARALVGLAESSQLLGDATSREWGRTSLTTVNEHFGDTPSAARARELLKAL